MAGGLEASQSAGIKRPRLRALRRDLKVLANFIAVYCRHQHRDAAKHPIALKTLDVHRVYRKALRLCPSCAKLLEYSFVKRTRCPYDPKPACKKCPAHCYAPKYRAQIRGVMKVSGRRLVLRGRLDYIFHLLS